MKKLLLVLLCLPLLFSSCYFQNEEQKALTELCSKINSMTPMMVKENLEFTTINCKYPKVEISYRYTDYESGAYNDVMKALEMKYAEQGINNNEGFSEFREEGYMFVMSYLDKNYNSLFYLLLMQDANGIYNLMDDTKLEESELISESNTLDDNWNDFYKLEFEKPEAWLDVSNIALKDLLKNVDYSKEVKKSLTLRESNIVKSSKFTKNDPVNYAGEGYIDFIHITLKHNPYNNHTDFKSFLLDEIKRMDTIFNNHKLESEVSNVRLDGINGYTFETSHEVPFKNVMTKSKSCYYVFPVGKYYYNINYTSGESDDYYKLSNSLSKSIKFKK